MATTKGVLLLSNKDNLETVVKKCNANFKAVLTQQSQVESNVSQGQDILMEEVDEKIATAVGGAVDSLVADIGQEANARAQGDLDLQNAIGTVDGKIPVMPVDCAYTTFGAEDPTTVYGGIWSQVGTLPVGTETLVVWKKIQD